MLRGSWGGRASGATVSGGAELEAAFRGGWCFFQVCVDEVRGEKWDVVEESQVGCPQECLDGGAKEGLMHVFHPVLEVRDCVHIVRCVGCCLYGRIVGRFVC